MTHNRSRHTRLQRHPRLLGALVVAVVISAVSGWIGIRQPSGWIGIPTPFLLGFDGGASVFLIAVVLMMRRATMSDMSRRAAIEDEDRNTVLVLSAIVATAILLAILFELHSAKDLPPDPGSFRVALSVATILLSWFFTNAMFALHYAHEYYGDVDSSRDFQPHRGLSFPGHRDPDYWDFLYFSFVIGMTFQVSDVQVEDHSLRRLVLSHSVLAFLFNVVILAATVNIVADLI